LETLKLLNIKKAVFKRTQINLTFFVQKNGRKWKRIKGLKEREWVNLLSPFGWYVQLIRA